MAAYTLPEGFTEFDMFTFGTALLVGGKCSREKGPSCGIKGAVHRDFLTIKSRETFKNAEFLIVKSLLEHHTTCKAVLQCCLTL